jgi:hypothetical protein
MKISTIVKFINGSGVDVSYQTVYQIVKGKEMSFDVADRLSNVFHEKNIYEWKKTSGDRFISFFKKNMPETFLDENCGLKWQQKKIIDRYGEEIKSDLEKVKKTPLATLQGIADNYGFTREYARQIYKNYFGEPYTKALAKKTKKIKDVSCVNDPRHKIAEYKKGSLRYFGAVAEKLFMCRCELAGLDVVLLKDQSIDMMVNSYLVDVKAARKTKKKKYHFSASKKQTAECDFFACYAAEEDCFYIIPNNKKNKRKYNGFYIPVGGGDHKYSKYKNRFDLLT